MESDEAREALTAVNETRALNAARLERPRRYWLMVGLALSVFGLIPYATHVSPLAAYIVPPVLVAAIALLAGWRQPSAVRKIKLAGSMWLPLLGFALVAGVLAGANTALFGEHGWWWSPLVTALLILTAVMILGPSLDRSWARRVSGIGR